MAEPSATARDQKPVDDLHPNGVMRQVASGKRSKFLSELGQDLKLPFDVANWDFQLCDKWEPCQPPRRQFFRWPIPLFEGCFQSIRQGAAKQRARTLGDHLTSPTPSTWRPSIGQAGNRKFVPRLKAQIRALAPDIGDRWEDASGLGPPARPASWPANSGNQRDWRGRGEARPGPYPFRTSRAPYRTRFMSD